MCLETGLFSRATIKPLNKIYNLENEKKLFMEYIKNGEWFTVAGIRRVGKTTLVRSIVEHLGIPNIYLNLWEIDEDRPFQDFVFRLTRSMLAIKDPSWRKKLRSIEEVSIFGFRVRIKHTQLEFYLDELVESVIPKKRLVIILDEVHTLGNDLRKLSRLLAVLHDKYAPRLSIVLLGSVASIKNLFESKSEEAEPLYGRITREFILKPLAVTEAKKFLFKGFEECGINIKEETVERAIDELGTITGWLVEFGREYVLEARALKEVDTSKIVRTIQKKSRLVIYGEIARALKGKKRPDIYIRILKLIATNPHISLSELSNALKRKKPTILQYIRYLTFRNIVKAENGYYNITDPLYRRAILQKDFEIEVKKRL